MERALEIQQQARDNVNVLKTYMTDLQNWESEMKRKEAALNGESEQDLPPVRSKLKKEKPLKETKKPEKKILGSDYESWDKFDVDKACKEVDMENVGPTSLDSKKSQKSKEEKLRDEALHEKERGNSFVKQEKWDEAIACYNRAIELVKDDAIYYANRGLCYLMKESLHQSEADCTEALRLDPTYVKAFQRRATAREKLGSLRAATSDLNEVLKLEPHNVSARRQLESIKARMGTKGAKSKCSPTTTPIMEAKPFISASKTKLPAKVVEVKDEYLKTEKTEPNPLDKWRDGIGENITVIKPVKKPPHLRSKRPLKSIPIQEIQLGNTTPNKPATRMEIVEIESDLVLGDSNNNNNIDEKYIINTNKGKGEGDEVVEKNNVITSESLNVSDKGDLKDVMVPKTDLSQAEQDLIVKSFVPPTNSVQFMTEWKNLEGNENLRAQYLNIIDPSKLPSIFANALESTVLSQLLTTLHRHKTTLHVSEYLRALTTVRRFSALAMFLSQADKQVVSDLLQHCGTVGDCSEPELAVLRNKFEL